MAFVHLGHPCNFYSVRGVFRDLGQQVSPYFERFGSDLVNRFGVVFDFTVAEQLVVFCGGGSVADSYRILVFTAGAKVEIQVSIPL